MLTFKVPSGIGDVSWMYSKLKCLGRNEWEIADGWPHRTVPFMNLLPEVAKSDYGPFNYNDILAFESVQGIEHTPRWQDIKDKHLTNVMFEANRHLEQGRPLAQWCPDLPVDYHYDINTSEEDKLKARNKISKLPKPWTGVSAASYRGSEAWKTWGYADWSPFLKAWHAEVGGTIFLLGGFWDDLTDTLADDGWTSLVGKTSIGTAVETLRLLDYYIGFSSGLGVLRTVLRKNAFLLWPDFQAELAQSWAPPHMIESGEYVAQLWRDHTLVIRRARKWLREMS